MPPEAVALCPSCKLYRGPEEAGTRCDCGGLLVRRRGWICKRCELANVFFSRKAFDRDQQDHDSMEDQTEW